MGNPKDLIICDRHKQLQIVKYYNAANCNDVPTLYASTTHLQ